MSVPFLACLAEYQHTAFLLCFCLSYCTSCRWAAGNFLLSVNSCACTCVLRQRHSLTGFPSTPIFNAVTIVQGGGSISIRTLHPDPTTFEVRWVQPISGPDQVVSRSEISNRIKIITSQLTLSPGPLALAALARLPS